MITFTLDKLDPVNGIYHEVTVDDMSTVNRLIGVINRNRDWSIDQFLQYMTNTLTDYYHTVKTNYRDW
jgi:hypothetical protein